MKWRLILAILSINLLLISPLLAYPDSQTHKLDTETYQFQLSNGSRIAFGVSWIYLGSSSGLWSWIEDDGIKFYNLEVDSAEAPDPWEVHISSNTNITIGRLFKDGEVDLSISVPEGANSSLRFSCGGRGSPHSVTGLDTWEFNSSTSYLNLTTQQSKNVLISWRGGYHYWPQPDYPSIPIIAQVDFPSIFYPSFLEFLKDRLSIGFTVRIVNEDTLDHSLGLAYHILSKTGELIQEEELDLEILALSDKTVAISVEVPFHKKDEPKEYRMNLNLTRDGKLIMDPISHTLTVAHNPLNSLIYTLVFIGGITVVVSLAYVFTKKGGKIWGD